MPRYRSAYVSLSYVEVCVAKMHTKKLYFMYLCTKNRLYYKTDNVLITFILLLPGDLHCMWDTLRRGMVTISNPNIVAQLYDTGDR